MSLMTSSARVRALAPGSTVSTRNTAARDRGVTMLCGSMGTRSLESVIALTFTGNPALRRGAPIHSARE